MNVYTMPGISDVGMVWMGASQSSSDMSMSLMSTENSNELMLEQDNPYFTPSHNSTSDHSLDNIHPEQDSSMAIDGVDMLPYADMKIEVNENSYMDEDSSQTVYMVTTATQTILPCTTRKIKPVKHPGLVLKTPIAYQSDTDPSVIPIQKDGIAVCEKCGAIGVKHAFYTRERRFCSMACARGYSGLIPEPLPQTNETTPDNKQYAEHRFTMEAEREEEERDESVIEEEEDEDDEVYLTEQPLPQLPPPPATVLDDNVLLSRNANNLRKQSAENSYDWENQFYESGGGKSSTSSSGVFAAPVNCFKHAPLADMWTNIMVGMKVEVENTDCERASETFPDSFWVASVVKIVGYKALLRYEGFGTNETKDFWVTLCSNHVHPVGWCATKGKPLIPPKTIENKYRDWKEFLCKRLTGARTLPSNFSNKVNESMRSRFRCGLHLEVVDKNRISQVKVAVVHQIIGKRLNVKYYDSHSDDSGFWCHEDSPLLHPVGWANRVGHRLVAPVEYLERINEKIFDEDDATDDLFARTQRGSVEAEPRISASYRVGMKLEAVDPLNLSSICVATVTDLLRHGYIMIRIDTYESDGTGADWFCYHASSPTLFPIGFCKKYDIALTPPCGYDDSFEWKEYLIETGCEAAPVDAPLKATRHGFGEGMKLEAADLMDPRLVCVATVAKVAGRMLKVHFDGWEDEYDQWLDCESPDIYPVGWCLSVGHKLEGPKIANVSVHSNKQQQFNNSNKGVKKRGRKKKKDSPPKNNNVQQLHHQQQQQQQQQQQYYQKITKIENSDPVEVVEEENMVDDNIQEPEAGQEPSGPDQSMPVSSDLQPPPERKATSYITNSITTSAKVIPRLIDSSGSLQEMNGGLCPEEWNVFDVAQFLRVNDCANYCDAFSKQKVDGKTLLKLDKEDIIHFTGGKVGPSLKIYDLIQQLKIKVSPAQLRHMKNVKKFL